MRPPGLRVNHRIRAHEVRVIGPDGAQLGIMSPELAREKAAESGMDLVEMSPDSRPPVCRMMDYGKFKYAQKKKTAETKKKSASQSIKEVKYRLKIEEHDFQFKTRRIATFLGEGSKVKVTIMFRGREITRQDTARQLLGRVAKDIAELGSVEATPRLEGRNMVMLITPTRQASAVAKPGAEA